MIICQARMMSLCDILVLVLDSLWRGREWNVIRGKGERRKVVYFLSLFYPCAYVLCAFSCGMVAPFHSLWMSHAHFLSLLCSAFLLFYFFIVCISLICMCIGDGVWDVMLGRVRGVEWQNRVKKRYLCEVYFLSLCYLGEEKVWAIHAW